MARIADILSALEQHISAIEAELPLLDRGRDAVKIREHLEDLPKSNEILRQVKRRSGSWLEQWRIHRIRKRVQRVLDQLNDIIDRPVRIPLVLYCLLCCFRCC